MIGVHSAKFTTEKETDNIRKAVLRHGLKHPVVNDSEFLIWRSYRVRAWPTLVLIDPEGNAVWARAGEGNYDELVRTIDGLIRRFDKKLDRTPLSWKLETQKESVLSFPGKIVATHDRLYISDTNHHRILITDHAGKVRETIGPSVVRLDRSHPQ